jgi:hypothetical protein
MDDHNNDSDWEDIEEENSKNNKDDYYMDFDNLFYDNLDEFKLDEELLMKLAYELQEKCVTDKNTECFIWTGSFYSDKGRDRCFIRYDNRSYDIAPILLQCKTGYKLPISKKIIRSCNNTKCLNIEHLDIDGISPDKIMNNINEKSKKITEGEYKDCIVHTTIKKKYPTIKINGKARYITHFVYMYHNKINVLPRRNEHNDFMVIRHKCNNEFCINPLHLIYGTSSQNCYEDKIENGTLRDGETSPHAKITQKLADKILASKGSETQKQRAKRFKVSIHIVKHIDSGHSWVKNKNSESNRLKRNANRTRSIKAKEESKAWDETVFSEAKAKLDAKLEEDEDGCLIYIGKKKINVRGVEIYVHRLAVSIELGRLLKRNEKVFQTCRKKTCCNIDHLEYGETLLNAATHRLKSNNNHLTKIPIKYVKKIRRYIPKEKKDETIKLKDLDEEKLKLVNEYANKFDVSKETIMKIVNYKTFKNI